MLDRMAIIARVRELARDLVEEKKRVVAVRRVLDGIHIDNFSEVSTQEAYAMLLLLQALEPAGPDELCRDCLTWYDAGEGHDDCNR